MLERIHELVRRQESFAFESTLAARSFAVLLRDLAAQGYGVSIIYLWLRDPELAVSRVAERARRGGHRVPPEVIRRRYWGELRNLLTLYRPLARTWVLYDNSEGRRVRVAYALAAGGEVVVQSQLRERILEEAEQR